MNPIARTFNAFAFTPLSKSKSSVLSDSGATRSPYPVITSSSDGLTLAIAFENGYILTSNDAGSTWTKRTSVGLRRWTGISSSSDGLKLAACAWDGYIYTSNDGGATWVERTNPGIQKWSSIALSDNGTIVACVDGGFIFRNFSGGDSWWYQSGPFGFNVPWKNVAISADGVHMVATYNMSSIAISHDQGNSWSLRSPGGYGLYSVSISAAGSLLAVGSWSGYIYTSSDGGVNWTERTSVGSRWWLSIASSSDGFRLAALASTGLIFTSSNGGSSWVYRQADADLWSIDASSNGLRLVTIGSSLNFRLFF